jgi:hypothetical protein
MPSYPCYLGVDLPLIPDFRVLVLLAAGLKAIASHGWLQTGPPWLGKRPKASSRPAGPSHRYPGIT